MARKLTTDKGELAELIKLRRTTILRAAKYSSVIVLPIEYVKYANLSIGQNVAFGLQGNNLIIKPIEKKKRIK